MSPLTGLGVKLNNVDYKHFVPPGLFEQYLRSLTNQPSSTFPVLITNFVDVPSRQRAASLRSLQPRRSSLQR